MPLRTVSTKTKMGRKARQKVASKNIREFSHGKTFARTAKKFGTTRARKQAIAVGMRTAGLSRRRKGQSRR